MMPVRAMRAGFLFFLNKPAGFNPRNSLSVNNNS
jgi:hypothetical protein